MNHPFARRKSVTSTHQQDRFRVSRVVRVAGCIMAATLAGGCQQTTKKSSPSNASDFPTQAVTLPTTAERRHAPPTAGAHSEEITNTQPTSHSEEEQRAARRSPGISAHLKLTDQMPRHPVTHDRWWKLMESNRSIQAAANEWLTWKRPQLLNTWRHYQMLKKQIKPAFDQAGITEPLFVAIMAQESGGRVHSSSHAGAAGLFQLMPATARRLGLHGSHGDYDLRYSPQHAAQAAARFLTEQMQRYDGDLGKVLAAYNRGENAFARLNRRHRNGSLWNSDFYYDLPAETRHYVPQVLAAMLLYKYPEKFNLKLPTVSTPTAIKVHLSRPASLSQLAVCLGQKSNPQGWYRDLRNLNHGIRADRDLPAGASVWIPAAAEESWHTQCQNDALMALAHQLHQADFPEKPPMLTYVVRAGDALSTIARRFSCTSRQEVARLNRLKGPRYLIRVGQKLKIPRC